MLYKCQWQLDHKPRGNYPPLYHGEHGKCWIPDDKSTPPLEGVFILLWNPGFSDIEYLDTVWEGGSGLEYLRNLSLWVNWICSFHLFFLVNCQRLLCCLRSCCDLSGVRGVSSGVSRWNLSGRVRNQGKSAPFQGISIHKHRYLPRDSTVRGQLTDKSIPSGKHSEALDTGFLALTLGIRVYVFSPSILTNSGLWKFPFTSSANHDVLATLSNLQVL